MSHPHRYDSDDPLLERLRHVCLALPGVDEKVSHGRPVFFTKKIFAIFGGVVKGDHHSDMYDRAVLTLPDADEREALLQDERFFDPAYYGPSGWVGFLLDENRTDWQEVGELIEASYRNTALVRLVRELDAL